MGAESPELAASLLKNSNYIPRTAQDMWSFALTMLHAMGGCGPAEHTAWMLDPVYLDERAQGNRLPAYLQYLADLSADPKPYADQVLASFH